MKRWFLPVKVAISAGLLWYLLRNVEFGSIIELWRNANWWYLALALLLFNVGLLLVSMRTRLLVAQHGQKLPLIRLFRSTLIGMFFNNFLPTSIGGDVYRMYDINRALRDKTLAASTILVDRFCGFLALFLIGFVAALSFRNNTLPAHWLYPMMIAAVVGLLVSWLLFFPPKGWARLMSKMAHALPGVIGRIASKIVDSITPFNHRPKLYWTVIGYSVLLQANVALHFWLISKALGITLSPLAFFVINPIAQIIMLLPISVNAIGVRDYIFATLLGFYGVTTAESLGITLSSFALVLIQGCVGGIIFALHRNDYADADAIAKAAAPRDEARD